MFVAIDYQLMSTLHTPHSATKSGQQQRCMCVHARSTDGTRERESEKKNVIIKRRTLDDGWTLDVYDVQGV